MRPNFNESTAFRFSVLLFVISLGIATIASCIEMYMIFQENQKLAKKSIQQVTESHIPSLISSLWLTNAKLLQDQVDAIERFKYIASVELIDSDNNRFSAGEAFNQNHRLITRGLFYEFRGKKTPIGKLNLYIDDYQIQKDTLNKEIPIFFLHFFQSLIVAIVIGFLFRRIVGRHLEAFSQYLVKSRNDPTVTRFRFNRKRAHNDELESMLKSFDILMTAKTKAEAEQEKLIKDLQNALNEVKTLKGFIPICVKCKKIRDDEGYWNQIESYIEKHSDAQFSHGLCTDCSDEIYGDQEWYKKAKKEGKYSL